jgi:rod shape determining protein RodA
MYRVRHILLSGFYVILPAFLLFFQPDLGSVIILSGLWLGVLLISGIKLRHFLILAILGIVAFIFAWNFFLLDYQKERIAAFFSPQDPLGSSWSQNQAKIAIGSGGILGKGFGSGSQTQLGFLPEPQTDFIFAALAEEFGLAGVAFLILLFSILLWRIIKIALKSRGNFPRLFAAGFAVLLIFQIFISVGMNLGLLPIIGIPLPLLSYGGSNLIMAFIGLGILQSMKKTTD